MLPKKDGIAASTCVVVRIKINIAGLHRLIINTLFLREVIFSLWLWKDLLLVMQEHCGLCLLHIPPVLPLPRQI